MSDNNRLRTLVVGVVETLGRMLDFCEGDCCEGDCCVEVVE